MRKIIGGRRYNTETSTLLADNEYADNSNRLQKGRGTYLYRTPRNAYFKAIVTIWQNEQNSITPLTIEEAQELYERLPNQYLEYEDAFFTTVEEAAGEEPPTSMININYYAPEHHRTWLQAQPRGMSQTLRDLVDAAMQEQVRSQRK